MRGGGSMLSRVGYCKAMASGFRSSKSEFWFITHFLRGLKTTCRGVSEYVPSWMVDDGCSLVVGWFCSGGNVCFTQARSPNVTGDVTGVGMINSEM